MLRQEKSNDRYESEKGNKFMEYISKELMYSRGSTYDKARSRNNVTLFSNKKSGVFPNNTKIKPHDSFHGTEMYSQPQLVKQRRGASILRSSSKTKCRESMSKFRKDFVKDASFNFYDGKEFMESGKQIKEKRIKSSKEENNTPAAMGIVFDEELDVEEIHYQMVKLHQNLKQLHLKKEM